MQGGPLEALELPLGRKLAILRDRPVLNVVPREAKSTGLGKGLPVSTPYDPYELGRVPKIFSASVHSLMKLGDDKE